LFGVIKSIDNKIGPLRKELKAYRSQEAAKKRRRQDLIAKGKVTKRTRRGAGDIKRLFKCPIKECGKSYGSEGSLS
jgi:hypothetical protein